MTHAAYNAFYAGLRAALFLSAILVFLGGIFAYVTLGRRHRPAELDSPGVPAGTAGPS